MTQVRIGVIGLGWFGEVHCDAISSVGDLRLEALCTRTEDRLHQLSAKYGVEKTYTDYREMLADPSIDAVSIATMWDQHVEPAVQALGAGKHVFLEKPMASTVAECHRIIEAAKESPGILQIGHICRFNPRFRAAHEAIQAGRIGRIVALSSRRNIPAAWTAGMLDKIGPLMGDAIHDTDLML